MLKSNLPNKLRDDELLTMKTVRDAAAHIETLEDIINRIAALVNDKKYHAGHASWLIEDIREILK